MQFRKKNLNIQLEESSPPEKQSIPTIEEQKILTTDRYLVEQSYNLKSSNANSPSPSEKNESISNSYDEQQEDVEFIQFEEFNPGTASIIEPKAQQQQNNHPIDFTEPAAPSKGSKASTFKFPEVQSTGRPQGFSSPILSQKEFILTQKQNTDKKENDKDILIRDLQEQVRILLIQQQESKELQLQTVLQCKQAEEDLFISHPSIKRTSYTHNLDFIAIQQQKQSQIIHSPSMDQSDKFLEKKTHRQNISISQNELHVKVSELIRQNNELAQDNASLQYTNLVLKNEVEFNLQMQIEQIKNKMFLSRIDDQKEEVKEELPVQNILGTHLLSQSFDINKKQSSIKIPAKKPNYFQDFNLMSDSSLSQRKINSQKDPINSNHYFKTSNVNNKTNFYIESIKNRLESLKLKKEDLKLTDFQNYFAMQDSPKEQSRLNSAQNSPTINIQTLNKYLLNKIRSKSSQAVNYLKQISLLNKDPSKPLYKQINLRHLSPTSLMTKQDFQMINHLRDKQHRNNSTKPNNLRPNLSLFDQSFKGQQRLISDFISYSQNFNPALLRDATQPIDNQSLENVRSNLTSQTSFQQMKCFTQQQQYNRGQTQSANPHPYQKKKQKFGIRIGKKLPKLMEIAK